MLHLPRLGASLQTSARYPQVATSTGNFLSSSEIDEISLRYRKFNLSDPEYARQLESVGDAARLRSK